ncbi:DUF6161 domain-containing protein [Sulfuricurvum sp.]|uniref:DUF6161 domain-containing protein n=1 Tax=Sulfuricurvum sp. TaxID=2025608 RepID=UPI0026141B14|nr:DUF6161 domain-containing protein [Sulfuricurvum sp.]MDD3598475.1 DUF6161 domain-containing protein [Sulfuricurvum sp.]
MNNNELISLLKELKINLQSNSVIEIINKESQVVINDLNDAIEGYIANADTLFDEPLIKTLIQKTKQLIEYTNKGDFRVYVAACTPPANFIINSWKEFDPTKKESIEDSPSSIISEEEFSKRYDALLQSLNFEGEESNLVLESLKDRIPFQVFNKENNLYIVPLKKVSSPMWFSKESLIDAIYKTKRKLNQYEATIVEKLNNNSIFDFLIKVVQTDLLEAMKNKILNNENELLKLSSKLTEIENNNQELSTIKQKLGETLEESKLAKKEYEDAKQAAVDYAQLDASVSYWKTKQGEHRKKFWRFGGGAIVLIAILIGILYATLYSHENLIKNKKIISETNTSNEVPKIIQDINKSTNVTKQVLAEQKKDISNNEENSKCDDFDYSKLAWYILMIFASSSVFWIIRITVKIALSNLHLSEDAYERVVMIQTYLSFVKEGQISEDDKNLILSSLFRPSNIGIIKDESSVTVADIVTAFKK